MQTYMSAPMQLARRYWRMSLVRGIVAIIFGLLAVFWPHLTYLLFMRAFGIFAIIEGILLLENAFSQRKVTTQNTSYAQQTDYRRDPGYQRGAAERPRGSGDYQGNAGTNFQETSERFQREMGYQGNADDERREPGYQRDSETYDQRSAAARRAESRRTRTTAEPAEAATRPRTNKASMLIEGSVSIICGILAIILPAIIGALAVYAIAAWALFKGFGTLAQAGTRGWVLAIIGILAFILGVYVLLNPITLIRSFLWIVGIFSLIMGVLLVIRAIQHNAKTAREARAPEPNY